METVYIYILHALNSEVKEESKSVELDCITQHRAESFSMYDYMH
jgi:hypothetical protein